MGRSWKQNVLQLPCPAPATHKPSAEKVETSLWKWSIVFSPTSVDFQILLYGSLMEIIPELVTDLPHRKAWGKGFLVLPWYFPCILRASIFYGGGCVFSLIFFFWKWKDSILCNQKNLIMGPEEQNATPYHKAYARTVGFEVSTTRQIW